MIDTANNSITANIPVGVKPYRITVAPNGDHAYISNSGSNTISEIDIG